MKYQNSSLYRGLFGLSLMGTIATGCGDNLEDVDTYVGTPVQTLQVSVPDDVIVTEDDVPRAALLWTALSQELEDCFDGAPDQEAVYNCAVAFYRPQVSSVDIPLDPGVFNGFAIPIQDLPAPDALSGGDAGRIGWGNIVLYDDENENAELDLLPAGTENSIDSILGVSEQRDEYGYFERSEFVVFREGELSPLWRLFRGFGCADPDEGYSIVSFGWEEQTYEYEDEFGNVYEGVDEFPYCTLSPADEPIGLFAPWDDAESMLCFEESLDEPGYPEPIAADETYECYEDGNIIVVNDAPSALCPSLRRLDLVGCDDISDDDDACAATLWDFTDNADRPTWWPCEDTRYYHFRRSPGLETEITDGVDDLFRYSLHLGGPVSLDNIEVEMEGPMGTIVFPRAAFSIIEDVDGDGQLSEGESFMVSETNDFQPFTASYPAGSYTMTMSYNGIERVVHQWVPTESQVELIDMEVAIEDAPEMLTDELLDPMAIITCSEILAPIPMSELRATIYWSGEIPLHIAPESLSFEDNDGDGLFGVGDRIAFLEDFTGENVLNSEDLFEANSSGWEHLVIVEQKIGFDWYTEVAGDYVAIY